jgi:hypothetical protein
MISRNRPARFRINPPTSHELPADPRRKGLHVLFLRANFFGFGAAIRLASDVDGERGVLESIPDGVEDDGIGDGLAPVIEG